VQVYVCARVWRYLGNRCHRRKRLDKLLRPEKRRDSVPATAVKQFTYTQTLISSSAERPRDATVSIIWNVREVSATADETRDAVRHVQRVVNKTGR